MHLRTCTKPRQGAQGNELLHSDLLPPNPTTRTQSLGFTACRGPKAPLPANLGTKSVKLSPTPEVGRWFKRSISLAGLDMELAAAGQQILSPLFEQTGLWGAFTSKKTPPPRAFSSMQGLNITRTFLLIISGSPSLSPISLFPIWQDANPGIIPRKFKRKSDNLEGARSSSTSLRPRGFISSGLHFSQPGLGDSPGHR